MRGGSDNPGDPRLTASEVLEPLPPPPGIAPAAPTVRAADMPLSTAPAAGAPAGAQPAVAATAPGPPGAEAGVGTAFPFGAAGDGAAPVVPGSGTRWTPGRDRWVLEWLAVLAVALVLALVVRAYVVQMFYIPSGSMLPTLQVGDRIIVDKLAYRIHGVSRGDVVVFRRPPLEQAQYSDLVKRVIGLPGDTISLVGGRVYIHGKPLSEPWLPSPLPVTAPSPHSEAFSLNQPFTVPRGEYYVMGDNRMNSEDSRYFGPISKDLIVGKMAFVAWPLTDTTGIVVLSIIEVVVLVLLMVELRETRPARAPPASEGTW